MDWLANLDSSASVMFVIAAANLLLAVYRWRTGNWGLDYQVEKADQQLLIKQKGLKIGTQKPEHEVDIGRLSHIQVASNVVSFFYQSGHAIDVFLPAKRLTSFISEVVDLVPNVEIINLDKESDKKSDKEPNSQ